MNFLINRLCSPVHKEDCTAGNVVAVAVGEIFRKAIYTWYHTVPDIFQSISTNQRNFK